MGSYALPQPAREKMLQARPLQQHAVFIENNPPTQGAGKTSQNDTSSVATRRWVPAEGEDNKENWNPLTQDFVGGRTSPLETKKNVVSKRRPLAELKVSPSKTSEHRSAGNML